MDSTLALGYVEAGLPIVPTENRGVPLIHGAHEKVYTEWAEVKEWYARWGSLRIGLPMGRHSGYVAVKTTSVFGEFLLQTWAGADLPLTWTFYSGGTTYRIYRLPPGVMPKGHVGWGNFEVVLIGDRHIVPLPPQGKEPFAVTRSPIDGPSIAQSPTWLNAALEANLIKRVRKVSSGLILFIRGNLSIREEFKVPSNLLYDAYVFMAREDGLVPISGEDFTTGMLNLGMIRRRGKYMYGFRPRPGSRLDRVLKGINTLPLRGQLEDDSP